MLTWKALASRAARSAWPHLVAGIAFTLFTAWGLPLMLTMRGIGPDGPNFVFWHAFSAYENEETGEVPVPVMEIRRSVFSDLVTALPSKVWPNGAVGWPMGPLETTEGSPRAAPAGAVLAPPAEQQLSWGRIDTRRAGWPFRAFAGEQWYRVSGPTLAGEELGYTEASPERRWMAYVADSSGGPLVVVLRPLPLGIVADVVFWASASWVFVAFPSVIRRRRRERLGRCGDCGHQLDDHAVKRPDKCPECGRSLPHDPLGFARSPEMHFQNHYTWFVFVSSLDIMLTWKILDRGGLEVNPVAKLVIDAWGMHGAIAFKFALMLWVIVACEILARLKRSAGKLLATLAVLISALPVAWSLTLLLWHAFVPE